MKKAKPSVDFVRGIEAFASPAQCLNDIVQSWTEYMKVKEEETTKRREIEAWEKAILADIETKHYFLMSYLERSFDERAQNFQSLFRVVEQAVSSGDNQQLALTLNTIVELAKSSPFKDLSDLSTVKAALDNPEHTWEF